jgi:hypothetical protein
MLALTYIEVLMAVLTPLMVRPTTITPRVPAAIGIERPSEIPLVVVPSAKTPDNPGAPVTRVPATGRKTLLDAGAV